MFETYQCSLFRVVTLLLGRQEWHLAPIIPKSSPAVIAAAVEAAAVA